MQNGVISEQYILYGQTDTILFQRLIKFQEIIGIFRSDITVWKSMLNYVPQS